MNFHKDTKKKDDLATINAIQHLVPKKTNHSILRIFLCMGVGQNCISAETIFISDISIGVKVDKLACQLPYSLTPPFCMAIEKSILVAIQATKNIKRIQIRKSLCAAYRGNRTLILCHARSKWQLNFLLK